MEKIISLILVIYLVWFVFKFIMLIVTNITALNAFYKVEQLLNKRYEIIASILAKSNNDNEEIAKYLEELKNLPKGKKFLNRKLALNYVLTSMLPENIESDEYRVVTLELKTLGDIYNHKADKLKVCTEVFPASFYARFLRIKPLDYYRG